MLEIMHMKHTITIVLFLKCLCFTYAQDTVQHKFLVAPYVLEVTTESATIAFHLNQKSNAKVKIWIDEEEKEYKSSAPEKSHFVKITGLQPGKSYNYQVICDDIEINTKSGNSQYQIRTSGKTGESFTFAVYGDPRPGDIGATYYHQAIMNQVAFHEPQFCLVLGDMVDNGSEPEKWEEFFKVEESVISKSAIYPVLGDNDVEDGKGIYTQYFPILEKGYYNFSWNGVQFFALNAWDTRGNQPREELSANSEQIQWFVSQMQKEEVKNAPYRIVYLHDPVYISRGRASDMLLDQWVPLFEKYNVDVVFASWHLYERLQRNGVTYIISGGAGAEIIWMPKNAKYPSQAEAQRHHFCRVDVNSNSLTIRAIADDGTVLDNFTISPKTKNTTTARSKERLLKEFNKQIQYNEGGNTTPLQVYLFSYDCNYCKKVIKSVLPGMAKKHELNLQLNYFDLGRQGVYELFLNAGAEFGRQDADIPALFIGNKVFGGEQEIVENLEEEIIQFKENEGSYISTAIVPFNQQLNTTVAKKEAFSSLTLGIVISAGLLDGINPCAFTTIIFLISYLSLVGASRKKMLYNGFFYVLAVFSTYFIIGLTFFSFTKVLHNSSIASVILNLVILLMVITLGVLSVVDYIKCKRGKSNETILQLPGSIKNRIRLNVRNFARNKIALAGASFGLGIVIAGMELTCTGQVYIPIVTLISDPAHRVQAVFYLLIYNLVFIVPLAIVFLIAAFGVSSDKIKDVFARNMATIKLSFAFMFGLMALIILYNIQWIF